jgi:cation diffusion facilitator family transporter
MSQATPQVGSNPRPHGVGDSRDAIDAAINRGQRLALIGGVGNVGLAMLKLLAGIVGHSYALIADAIESMADILGSAVIWSGLHIAARPADENHPYGHGKAESLAALIVALMVFAAGIGIGVKAVDQIIAPHHAPASWTLAVLVVVVVVKVVMFRTVRRAGRESGSGAVQVDAWHHWTDALTSLAAFVGITVALIGGAGWERADPIAALIASGVIVFNAFRLFRTPIRELMDEEPTDVVSRARGLAAAVVGVVMVEKVGARKSGARYWVDMHVWVDPAMSVVDAHEVSHRVKDAVRGVMPSVADVLVHIEPAR